MWQRALVSLLVMALVLQDEGLTLMTLFNLYYLFRGPVSKSTHTGVRALSYKLEGMGHGHSVHTDPYSMQLTDRDIKVCIVKKKSSSWKLATEI